MPFPTVTGTWGAEQWHPILLEALAQEAVLLRSGVNRIEGVGRVIHVPRLLVAPEADWVGELDPLPSDAGDADTLDLTPHKLGNIITLSRESIEDATGDHLNRIGRAMVRGVAIRLDAKAFSADAATATAPAGLLATANRVPSARAASVTITGLVGAVGEIVARGGTPNAIYVSPADLTALRLEALTGSYATLADPTAPGIERVAGATLYPVQFARGTALVADARYITVGVRRDSTVEFSRDWAFDVDGVGARITMRVDYGWTDPAAGYAIIPSA